MLLGALIIDPRTVWVTRDLFAVRQPFGARASLRQMASDMP
jgi:hypothetical protein